MAFFLPGGIGKMTQESIDRTDSAPQQAAGRKKLRVSAELTYAAAIVLLALAVAMLTAADFGISMIVAPAYLLSLKLGVVTFGQAEYIIQAGLFIVLCLLLRKCRPAYLMSFVTCLIYGAVLDLWRKLPCFDPTVTAPGHMALWLRIVMFAAGVLLTSFSVALFFKTYLYPQVYDFFVKAVSLRFGIRLPLFKTIVDMCCLLAATVMTLCFFGEFRGLNWGTLIMALFNGTIIGFFSKLLNKTVDFQPCFKGFAAHFALEEKKADEG